jgi:hypothetical protein
VPQPDGKEFISCGDRIYQTPRMTM